MNHVFRITKMIDLAIDIDGGNCSEVNWFILNQERPFWKAKFYLHVIKKPLNWPLLMIQPLILKNM